MSARSQACLELVTQHALFVGGAGRHRRQIGLPGDSRRPQMGQRHPVRAQHTDVPAGQRHVLELGHPPVALVVGEQHLATPDRVVGSVAGPVEGEAEHLPDPSRPCSAITAATCAWWCWTVRRAGRRRCGVPRPSTGTADARRRQAFRVRPRSVPEVLLCGVECGQRREVVHVADVLAQPGVLAVGDRHRVLEVPPTARVGGTDTGSATGSGAYPRDRRIGNSMIVDCRHRHGPRGRRSRRTAPGSPGRASASRRPGAKAVLAHRRRGSRSALRRGCPMSSPVRPVRVIAGSPNSSACSGV